MTSYSQDGCTALHLASQEGQLDVVRVLIEANARVNQRSKVMQPIHVECSYTSSVLFQLLLCLLPFFLIAHPFNLSHRPNHHPYLSISFLPPSLLRLQLYSILKSDWSGAWLLLPIVTRTVNSIVSAGYSRKIVIMCVKWNLFSKSHSF